MRKLKRDHTQYDVCHPKGIVALIMTRQLNSEKKYT